MKIFRTENMTWKDHCECMCGGYNYRINYYDVEAETMEEALAIAKRDYPNRFIGGYAREVKEKEYTLTEKEKLISRIAELEKALEECKKALEEFENLTK